MFKVKTILGLAFTLIIIGTSVECQTSGKLDCHPIDGATKERCETLGCVWSPIENQSDNEKSRVDEPWCFFPDDYTGYEVVSTEHFDSSKIENAGLSRRITLRRVRDSALGNDIPNVHVDIHSFNNGDLVRVRIVDADKPRFEPQIPKLGMINDSDGTQLEKTHTVKLLNATTNQNGFNSFLVIKRKNTETSIFQTDLRRLIFTDKFIQLNNKLNSPFVYGLGEHYDKYLKLADKFKTYSFWNTDKLPLPGGQRSYGGFPFYINPDKNNDGDVVGMYLRNSNAMDVVLQKDQSVTFRPIGGILRFFIFSHREPLGVVTQFQSLVGFPDMPPRWALGFHLCRYNYGSLNKTKLVWDRTRAAGIPFDVMWNDIDYMDRYNDFTYDHKRFAGLPEFVDELHEKHNMHYMILFDPGVSQENNYYPYQLGEKMDIFIKNATNQTLVGKVWNTSGRTVFPDFSNPLTIEYWKELFVKFQEELKFDGAWIDMNDISNFVDGSLDGCPTMTKSAPNLKNAASIEENVPYKPGGYDLQQKSLCLSARHYNNQIEYNMHNLYSFYEAIATRKALETTRPNKRSLIISRSTHPGQGAFGGHWSGDVISNWDYLKWSINSLLEHSMYGFSMIGTDICGFVGNTNPELCARWSTLGAFYTFSRNHNDDVSIDQDPAAMGADVISANKNAYTKKYSLLPYFYTLLYDAHHSGSLVARSVSFEFFRQNDTELLSIESQFMIGSALIVSPVVDDKTFNKKTYLPRGRWYETDILPESTSRPAKEINSTGQWVETHNVALDNLPLFIRGGHVMPVYTRVGPTIAQTVEGQPISLEVALCAKGRAKGTLIYDDGETMSTHDHFNSIEMLVSDQGTLQLKMKLDHYEMETQFGQVKIYGLSKRVSRVSVRNGSNLPFQQLDHMLVFDLQGLKLRKKANILVDWV